MYFFSSLITLKLYHVFGTSYENNFFREEAERRRSISCSVCSKSQTRSGCTWRRAGTYCAKAQISARRVTLSLSTSESSSQTRLPASLRFSLFPSALFHCPFPSHGCMFDRRSNARSIPRGR